jgi:hypothetical protein
MPTHALFTDQFVQEQQDQRFRGNPTREDRLMAAIVNWVRRANITVSPPAHIQPNIWSTPIDLSARVTVPAAVNPLYTTALTFKVPPGRWARINGYGVNVIDPLYTYDGSILWRFLLNGRPLPDGMSDWAQQRGSLTSPRETFIRLKEDDVLLFQYRRAVIAALPQDVDMAFIGWTWLLRNNFEGTAASVTAY